MPPALVQQATGSGSGTSYTVTLGSTPLAGSTLVLIGWDTVHTGVSVTGGGAIWSEALFTGGNFGVTAWVGRNCSGAAGLTVITYNMSSSANVRHSNVSEWTGLAQVPLEKFPAGTSVNTSTPSTTAITPTRPDGVVFGAVDWNSVNTIGAAGGGFTNLTQTSASNTKVQGAYQIHSAASSMSASWTLSGATDTDNLSFNLLGPETAPRKPVRIANPNVGPAVLRYLFRSPPSGQGVVTGPASYNLTATDSLTIADAPTRQGGFGRTVTDALGIADVATRRFQGSRVVTDVLTIADAATRLLVLGRTAAEGLNIADSATRTGQFLRSAADALNIADVATASKTFVRSATEALNISDAATRTGTFLRSVTASLTIADAATRLGSFVRSVSDSLNIADLATAAKAGGSSVVRTATEALNIADAASRTGTFLRSATASLSISDLASATRDVLVTGGLAPVGRAISAVVNAIADTFRPGGGASGPTPGGSASGPTPRR